MPATRQAKVRHCDDCAHREACPRMRGENLCHGIERVSVQGGADPEQPPEAIPRDRAVND